MSALEDIPSSTPLTKLHALKTSSSELVSSSDGLAFGSFESIDQPTFPEFYIRESQASSTASFFSVHRELHASRRSTRSSSARLDTAAVLGCPPLHAPREFQLSRGSRSRVHRESRRCSRNSFMTSVLNRTAPNHALQRTAPGCHGSCFLRSGVSRSSRIASGLGASSAVHLRSYRASPPPSLSLGSLGDSAHLSCERHQQKQS